MFTVEYHPNNPRAVWRVVEVTKDGRQDLCGAIDEGVAWATARILTDMRRRR